MRRSMIAHNIVAANFIDGGYGSRSLADRAVFIFDHMPDRRAAELAHIGYVIMIAIDNDRAGIGNLPARFRIEWGPIENDHILIGNEHGAGIFEIIVAG